MINRTADEKSSPTRTDASKQSDSLGNLTGIQGSLNVFKQGFDRSGASDKSLKTPGLGGTNKFRSSPPKVDEIPVDLEESEEYQDDFASSSSSAALAKVTATASGSLPPL